MFNKAAYAFIAADCVGCYCSQLLKWITRNVDLLVWVDVVKQTNLTHAKKYKLEQTGGGDELNKNGWNGRKVG